ncbi:hypothetical protein K9B32_16450 [Rhizobium sp. 3T7]|uniref:hypothetical protein n=1 Tax=Rhizobium sp. 3T7 TaxID=2874922 RepID=UPI001CCC3EC0|nr:hypothetical protein [Rhizobium sp. 3T7]MBZ9791697.1 hypothetical protein [Rhizobium sp. 3T7]
MTKTAAILVTATRACLSAQGAAACDFDKPPIGVCMGSIRILERGGDKPNFNAKVDVLSSVEKCSIVSITIVNTPWSFRIKSGGEQTGNVKTPNAVREDNTKVVDCKTYSDTGEDTATTGIGAGKAPDATALDQAAQRFEGRWIGSINIDGTTFDDQIYDIRMNGDDATVSHLGSQSHYARNGNKLVSDDETFTMQADGSLTWKMKTQAEWGDGRLKKIGGSK